MKINLLPWRKKAYQKQLLSFLIGIFASILLGLLILLLLRGILVNKISQLKATNQNLEQKYLAEKNQLRPCVKIVNQQRESQKFLQQTEQAQQKTKQLAQFFGQLPQQMPPTLHLTNIKKNGSEISLFGKAGLPATAMLFLQHLEKIAGVETVKLNAIKDGGDNFAITLITTFDWGLSQK